MSTPWTSLRRLLAVVVGLAALTPYLRAAEGLEPIVYTVRFPAPDKQLAEIEASVPTGGRPSIELMLAVWSPGFYRVDDVLVYVKGPVVGFLLDARIRRATRGTKGLEDVMRLAYKRYSGVRGFTPDEFRATAEEIAQADLKGWFHRAVSSTEELDYQEALDWFGLRFGLADDPSKSWKLEIRADATEAQQEHLQALVAPASGQ
jgi:predicted metalloprotease with PDZ domain